MNRYTESGTTTWNIGLTPPELSRSLVIPAPFRGRNNEQRNEGPDAQRGEEIIRNNDHAKGPRMNHPTPAMIYTRAVVADYLLQHLSIHGKDAERIIDGTPASIPGPGWRRSFAINEFARRIADCFPHLEAWQAERAAHYLLTYNPILDGIPALSIGTPSP